MLKQVLYVKITKRKIALIYSLAEGRTEFTKFLLSKGPDKNIKVNNGFSALDYTTSRGLRDTITLLACESEKKKK